MCLEKNADSAFSVSFHGLTQDTTNAVCIHSTYTGHQHVFPISGIQSFLPEQIHMENNKCLRSKVNSLLEMQTFYCLVVIDLPKQTSSHCTLLISKALPFVHLSV